MIQNTHTLTNTHIYIYIINQSINQSINRRSLLPKYNNLHIVVIGNEAMKSLFSHSYNHLLKLQTHKLYTTGNIITLITSEYNMIHYKI